MSDNLYMGVDNRRDHSFRIPRPDLNHKTSSPDACSSCHTGQTPEWAADKINTWFGEKQTREIHYGEILQNVLKGVPNSETALKQLLNDENIPVIIRASAYNLLPNFPNAESAEFIENGLQSKEPLIRLGAIRGSTFIPVSDREILLSPYLNDPFKAIRVEVVNSLSDMNINRLNEKDKDAYNMALDEFLTAQDQVMWRGEGRFNLGIFKTMQNETEAAKDLYLDAIKIDPFFPASYINLADIFKNQQDALNDGKTLDMGLSFLPDDADLNYAKALFLIREKQSSKAMNHLKIAVQAAPENPQYSYVYAVALTDMGRGNDAYNVLRNAIKYAENDANLNMMLLNHFANMGDYQKAIIYAEKLLQLFPNNPSIENTMRVLKSRLTGNT
jgi:tetratricopeptide (TPR) repeat protein